ncbi:hypothetical protein ACI6Q2_22485 [Chitinophagaceae bacterium LWZ2-11]
MKRTTLIFLGDIFLLFGCDNDLGLGMKYRKSLVAQINQVSVYSYHLGWGADSEVSFMSCSSDVCTGFDSTKDICFGAGAPIIYYKVKNDTLNIFSNANPIIPQSFPVKVKLFKIGALNFRQYKELSLKNEIIELPKDSFITVPCNPLPFHNSNNMKFRK